ncbi:MAG: regulatory protein RecX [Candidatus Acidiferrales bacterium]
MKNVRRLIAAFQLQPYGLSPSVFICVHLWLNSLVPFRTTTRKLGTEYQLNMSAQRALMRRAFSIHEMKKYLEGRAEKRELVPPVIARLRELNYLNDARYALEYTRHHAQARRQGRFRIARELRGRGVPDVHIDAALNAVFADTDEATLVRARLKRRLSHIRGAIDQKKLASLYGTLLRAGFSSDIIRKELRGVTHGDLPEFPNDAPGDETTE